MKSLHVMSIVLPLLMSLSHNDCYPADTAADTGNSQLKSTFHLSAELNAMRERLVAKLRAELARVCANVTCEGNRICTNNGMGRAECVCPSRHGRQNCDLLAPKCDTHLPAECNNFVIRQAIYYNPVTNQCRNVTNVVCEEKIFDDMDSCVTECVV